MERLIEIRTIGRDHSCDLVLDVEGIAEKHARVALGSGGGMFLIHDALPGGTELNRGSGWVVVRRARLCAGDRYRLAGSEIPVEALTSLFTDKVEVVEPAPGSPGPLSPATWHRDHSKRNPGTGQIESLPDEDN